MNKTTYIIETSNTYDAAGTKLRKVAYDNSGVLISRTEYIGGIQYESLQPLASPPLATDLKFMSTGEGRVVKEGSNWNYEYYHKDHLGNTRVVYGYQKQVDEYKATMETPTPIATKEESQFYNIATRRITVFNHTLANINVTAPDKSDETNGNTSKAIGPAKMLQVSAGDRVQLEVFASYQTGTGGNNALISNLASAVTGSFLLNAGEAAHTALTNSVPAQAATITQTNGVPKSYLFYILFNSSYVYQQFGYVLVNSTAQAGHQQMYLDITVPTGGYLYTYVANESNVSASSVYYGDFTIVHTRSTPILQVLQTSDYYPFGLQIAAGSYQKQTALDNDYLYNGKELQDEHNLGWMDYGARMYQPEIARWNAIDPSSENYVNQSPYHYAGNNPVLFVDYDGNDYGISVNHDSRTITISATFVSKGSNSQALNSAINSWNGQSGSFKYVIGKGKDAVAYDVVFDLTQQTEEGGVGDPSSGSYISAGDQTVEKDKTGEVNSFDTVPDSYQGGSFKDKDGKTTNGSSDGKRVSVREGKKNGNTSMHEIGHDLGLSHTNGVMTDVNSGNSISKSHVTEVLAGGMIAGDNRQRNKEKGLGQGHRRPDQGAVNGGSQSSYFNSGKVMSDKQYDRMMRKAAKADRN